MVLASCLSSAAGAGLVQGRGSTPAGPRSAPLPAGTVVLYATQTPAQLAETALAIIGPIGSQGMG
jgi:hypothetical protein